MSRHTHTLVEREQLSMREVVDLVEGTAAHSSITFDDCEIWNWDGPLIPRDPTVHVAITNSHIYHDGPLP